MSCADDFSITSLYFFNCTGFSFSRKELNLPLCFFFPFPLPLSLPFSHCIFTGHVLNSFTDSRYGVSAVYEQRRVRPPCDPHTEGELSAGERLWCHCSHLRALVYVFVQDWIFNHT